MYSIKKKVGDLELFILKDGQTEFTEETFNGSSSEEINKLLKLNNRKAIETNFNAFLIKSGERKIMIDAGAGALFGPAAGNLNHALDEVGIRSEEITDVIATHLHPDHIGGMISEDGNAVFINAGLVLTHAEYNFWADSNNFKEDSDDNKLPLNVLNAYSDRLTLINGDGDIGSGLTAINLPGHTAGHIGVMLSSKGEHFAIVGDIIHAQYLQIYNPDIGVVFDQDGELAKKSRIKMLDILAKDEIEFSGGHILSPALGYLHKDGTGYSWHQSNSD